MVRVQVVYNDKGVLLKGACGVKDLQWGKTKIASLVATTFSNTKNSWQGHLQLNRDELAVDGTWKWDQEACEGSLELENSSPIAMGGLPDLYIGTSCMYN